jgi:hypothetical protein
MDEVEIDHSSDLQREYLDFLDDGVLKLRVALRM